MSRVVVLKPGLLPVIHLISVAVELVITHGIPSITIEFSSATVENPVPVNVTGVLPTTVPNLGVMDSNFGVRVLTYFALLVMLFSLPYTMTLTSHSCSGV
jgi:hypothetical protein